jgi:hypothetical protein
MPIDISNFNLIKNQKSCVKSTIAVKQPDFNKYFLSDFVEIQRKSFYRRIFKT